MKTKLLLTLTLVALALTAKAQAPIVVTNLNNRFQWDASTSPNIVGYDVYITTNKTWITSEGYVPPAGAIITSLGVPGTTVVITNVWPGITNGVYSAFADARNASGGVSIWSSNVVFQIAIAPLPPKNVRIIPQ